MEYLLAITDLCKNFNEVVAVDHVSLNIEHGEFLTLLGPSGSGKTTTLNMVAGFEIPSSGEILLKDRDITTVPPYQRDIGMVFQNYALFPHMTVADNIAFPLKMRKRPSAEIKERVGRALEQVELPDFQKRYPNQLSGGQQQRVALARAIVFEPTILLMDEPLGALDKKLRDHMRLEIKHLQESLNITVIYVTHDQEEALTMSDRIAIMNEGRIIQIDEPSVLYETPQELFVADFIGESNFLEGVVEETDGDRATVVTREGLRVLALKGVRVNAKTNVSIAVRPEKMELVPLGAEVPEEIVNRFPGRIEEVVYVGEASVYRVSLAEDLLVDVKVQSGPLSIPQKPGDQVIVCWRARHGLALT